MAYSAEADVILRITSTVLTDLLDGLNQTNVIAACIAAADSEIDLWNTSDWTSAQKKTASVAFVLEKLYQLDSNRNVPNHIQAEADTWRSLLKNQEQEWFAAIYDPMLDETQDEIDSITLGPDLDRNL